MSDEIPDGIPCVGAVVADGAGRLLLIRRGKEPARGMWSVPGGRVEPGEDATAAVVREVREETGLAVVPGELLGRVLRAAPGGGTYVIDDYACALVGDAIPRAGDDADDAAWFTYEEVRRLPTSPGLVAALEEWAVLPPERAERSAGQ